MGGARTSGGAGGRGENLGGGAGGGQGGNSGEGPAVSIGTSRGLTDQVKTLAWVDGRGENIGERLWKGVESGGMYGGDSQWGSLGTRVKITCRPGEGRMPFRELEKQNRPRAGGMGERT